MIIIDRKQAQFEGDLRALDWGSITERILISSIKTARESFTMRYVYIPSTARERISFDRELAEIARQSLNGRLRYDFVCGN